MIQAIYKNIEIEMEMQQEAREQWRCDYTLIKHPERTMTIHHGTEAFSTLEIARLHALRDAQQAIDQAL